MAASGRIALIHTWPNLKNAEYEVVQRIKIASRNCGINLDIIDSQGRIIESDDSTLISRSVTRTSHLFAISLHFESPKIFDLYTYIALWNPLDYYHIFGFSAVTEKTCSHNDVLSCESPLADAHARLNFERLGKRYLEPIKLFHNCPQPYLQSSISPTATLFYVGINWERMVGRKGRFHDLLIDLDNDNMIDIYGPELFLNQRPWEGFANYKGEIPFDGASVVKAINRAGICLALSSKQHQESGILSNRLFEGMAGGAVVVTNKHPLVDKYFKECVYVIDDDQLSESEIAVEVKRIISEVRSDPATASQRVLRSQEILGSSFSLEASLNQLISTHADRSAYAEPYLAGGEPASISLICDYRDVPNARIAESVEQIVAQLNIASNLIILLSQKQLRDPDVQNIVGDIQPKSNSIFNVQLLTTSITEAFDAVDRPLLAFVRADEEFHQYHFASLAFALMNEKSALIAASGLLIKGFDKEGLLSIRFASNNFELDEQISSFSADYGFGRLMFKSEILRTLRLDMLRILDRHEVNLVAAFARSSSRLVETGIASYVWLKYLYPAIVSDRRPLRYDKRLVDCLLPAHPAIDQKKPDYNLEAIHPLPQEVRLDYLYRATEGSEGAKIFGEGFRSSDDIGSTVHGACGNISFQTPTGSSDLCIILRILVEAKVPSSEEGDVGDGGVGHHVYDIYLGDNLLGTLELTDKEQLLYISLPREREVLGRVYSIWINHSGFKLDCSDAIPAAETIPASFTVLSYKFIEAAGGMAVALHDIGSNSILDERLDPVWYLDRYQDVRDAGINPQFHFESYGRAEGRFPSFAAEKAAYWVF
ncbi:hypothetical protein [Methylobacterium sp. SI9]|uniref:glycosyltransferase family protein n=1 Tax=Methylobacterium guangdongense TaxID=3138811 RepID=UPI00313D91F0